MSETKSFDSAHDKPKVVQREERILNFWKEDKTFEKSLEKESPNGEYIFYDGPPFATGLPHYGNLIPGTIKDVIPRYKTMQGYKVPRRWGWDTHGLPIENLIEKELGLETKEGIEAYGIDKFNKAARNSVYRYEKEWKDLIPRTGRWIDMENAYSAVDSNFTESVWWMFSELYKKDYLSEGFKSMHLCPRCETTLSNFEVNQGYEDITDLSVTGKFELEDEPNTFILAWTTTPWTLPGNVGLAVNPSVTYAKVKYEEAHYVVAKEAVERVFKDKDHEVVDELKAEDLVGRAYKPIFDYYASNTDLKNRENGWKIYADDFVTTEEGTGVVHLAPAFGDEDYQLAKREKLPFVQHVLKDGTFKKEVTDFAGQKVKPKGEHQTTDIEIIKLLAKREKLFSKEKVTHSYPHCWRCDTPLLNFASSSWFIDVPKFRNQLIKENEKINWVPESVGKNRFGNWLKDAREWAISRSRFWGAPIPVWKSENGEEVAVMGSLDDIREKTRGAGKMFIIRHGEADHNVNNILSSDDTVPSHLTEEGKEQAQKQGEVLKGHGIDMIFASPLIRTKETADILAEALGLSKDAIVYDERITETKGGVVNGKPIQEYRAFFKSVREKFDKAHEKGETLTDMKKRVGDFLYGMDEQYRDKNVLVVTHEYVVWLMACIRNGYNKDQSAAVKEMHDDFVKVGEYIELDFAAIPHNEDYEVDMHRSYIDQITFTQNGKEMRRVEEVFDVWIDSGSMPFASTHYPFENHVDPKGGFLKKTVGYPADFIAEGLDQTRGWFYTLLVLNTALFGKSPYKNVIVNGLLLAENGRKMSKSLKNYPPIEEVFNTYGADAFRYFILASPLVRGGEALFSNKGIDEVNKKLLGRLDNVVTFYETYRGNWTELYNSGFPKSENKLDRWVLARLNETIEEVTNSLEKYELDRAARPLMDFVDDLSTWYLRRSRDRFKGEGFDKEQALNTTQFVLENFAKLCAPFIPFMAEDVYQRAVGDISKSVHLADWPKAEKVDQEALDEMKKVRDLVTQALEIRTNAGLKVRQPLAALILKPFDFAQGRDELLEILKDELNVKAVLFDENQTETVMLDQNLTPELKAEGNARELIRAVQSLRKQNNLSPEDEITLQLSDGLKELAEQFKDEITQTAKVKEFVFGINEGEVVKLDEVEYYVAF